MKEMLSRRLNELFLQPVVLIIQRPPRLWCWDKAGFAKP